MQKVFHEELRKEFTHSRADREITFIALLSAASWTRSGQEDGTGKNKYSISVRYLCPSLRDPQNFVLRVFLL